MTRAMFRYLVPVDDRAHVYPLTSDPVAGANAVHPHAVEFWAEPDDQADPYPARAFRVFGTGHPLPEGARWVGTCPRTRDGLVWHLVEVSAK